MKRIQIVAATIAALAVLSGGAFYLRSSSAETKPAAAAQPQAHAGPGRGDRRARSARPGTSSPAGSKRSSASTCARASPGRCKAVHFTEGALVKRGDLLVTIDPDPYAAEVDRAQAQVVAAQARLTYAKSEHAARAAPVGRKRDRAPRARRARERRAGSRRQPARRASRAAVGALEPAVHRRCARRSPAASAGSRSPWATWSPPVRARRCSPRWYRVNPIYASFDADEHVVLRVLHDGQRSVPVEAETVTNGGAPAQGPAAAHRQPGEHAQRHGARARGVRQQGRQPDPRPVREAAHGQGEGRARAAGERARDRHRPEQALRDRGRAGQQGDLARGHARRHRRRPAHRHLRPRGRRAHRGERPAARAAGSAARSRQEAK